MTTILLIYLVSKGLLKPFVKEFCFSRTFDLDLEGSFLAVVVLTGCAHDSSS